MIENALGEIPGGTELCQWFGCVPSFHDAEVLDLCLDRSGPSRLRIHAWNMRADEDGFLVRERHAIVTFVLDGLTDLELSGFSHQNVIDGLTLRVGSDGWVLQLEDCYGLSGSLTAREVRVEFQPGQPQP